jgi:hypothetical protein
MILKKYTNLNYFGVDVTGSLDASQMLYFHIDVWTPDLTAFRVKLVDFWFRWGVSRRQ